MKTQENFISFLMESDNLLNKHEMNSIRGGSNGGGTTPIDEDILLRSEDND